MRDLVTSVCKNGFHLHSFDWFNEDSERLKSEQQQVIAAEVEKFYKKAKEILALNSEFLGKVAVALAKKKLLSSADIQLIKSQCSIQPVAL